ncbi:efflux RND transporter permease subunit, partial [Candidatus Babeliales bacterium]|nr:efflux RND transporter permease subunit [Candidatus Babeliales bacterium]
ALLGTFASMYALGFSINVLTMFGMVLAIGILVDDAIVVVEAVERIMSAEGLSPRDATRKAMSEITGALIGISVVLTAVFIPMAFFGGSVGTIYRQFSMALVASMLFSVFLALKTGLPCPRWKGDDFAIPARNRSLISHPPRRKKSFPTSDKRKVPFAGTSPFTCWMNRRRLRP